MRYIAISAIVAISFGMLGATPGSGATLVGHWSLEQGSGTTAFDQSTTDNDGTLVNSPTWETTGLAPVPSGTSAHLEFSGEVGNDDPGDNDEDYVSIPANAAYDFGTGTDFSVAGWIKTSSDTAQNIVGQGDAANSDGGEHWELTIRPDGTFVAFIDDGTNTELIDGDPSGSTATGPTLSDGTWHHVAVTFDRDGNAIRYVDGVAYGTDDISNVGNINNDKILAIGQRGNASGLPLDSPFDGRIDDVRLYTGVLEPGEVSALAIPEPASLAMLGFGALALVPRRRN